MQTIKEKTQNTFKEMKDAHNYRNIFEAPRLIKVVVSVGVGKMDDNKRKVVEDRLLKITGQKPSPRPAKQSIASFKLREGETIGYQVTLRGERMFNFVDRLVNFVLPRAKDFRGISKEAVDSVGNYTLGLKEHTVFPETSDEDLKDVFGMSITLVTGAKNPKEAQDFLTHIGMPFKK